jgi:hypothetical protein
MSSTMAGGTQQRFRSTCASVRMTGTKYGVLAFCQHPVRLFVRSLVCNLRVDCAVGQFFAATEER